MAKSHGFSIVAIGVDTAHNPLIITEEEDGKTGHSIDGNQQRALLQPPGHIELGNAIHDGRRWRGQPREVGLSLWRSMAVSTLSLPHVLIGREEEDIKIVEEGWRSGR